VSFPPWYTENSQIREWGGREDLSTEQPVHICRMEGQQLYIEARARRWMTVWVHTCSFLRKRKGFGQVRMEIQGAASPKEPGLVSSPQEGSSMEGNDFLLWFKGKKEQPSTLQPPQMPSYPSLHLCFQLFC